MVTSEKITTIAPALLAAQMKMSAAVKGAENPFFKSKYADYTEVLKACKEALNSNDIIILQPHNAEKNTVETILLHSSGEFISSETRVVFDGMDAQKMGSAITYARRYGLQSLIALPAEDDDANSVSSKKHERYVDNNDTRPWLSEGEKKEFLLRIKNGEDVVEELKKFRMKNLFRTELLNAMGK